MRDAHRVPLPVLSPNLARAVARLSREADVALASLELSQSQYRLLTVLSERPLGASRLADLLSLSPPSVTSLLDGLAARELVVRKPDPADRRRVVLALTAKGKRVAAKADRAVATRIHHVATHTNGSAQALLDALDGWHDALDRARLATA